MTEAAVFQCFPAVLGYLYYVELMSLLIYSTLYQVWGGHWGLPNIAIP